MILITQNLKLIVQVKSSIFSSQTPSPLYSFSLARITGNFCHYNDVGIDGTGNDKDEDAGDGDDNDTDDKG